MSKQADLKEFERIASLVCEKAKKKGAQQAAASLWFSKNYKVVIRDGKQEEISSSVSRGLSLSIYIDGRYGSHSTSILEETELKGFVEGAVDMTKLLMPDKFRALPDPKYYQNRSQIDLVIFDPSQADLTMEQRKARAMQLYQAAKDRTGTSLISAGAGVSDSNSLSMLYTTNGFSDHRKSTYFSQYATVSAKDPSGRRPSDWSSNQARMYKELVDPKIVGDEAAKRALDQMGAGAIDSIRLPLIIENRAVSGMLGGFFAPLYGSAIDQKRSCFEDSLNTQIASKLLTIKDMPLLTSGFASRRYDREGMSTKNRPIIEKGVLKTFYLDNYYARKLKREPTSGSMTNLLFSEGKRNLDSICKKVDKAILVTGFLGGNSNSTTGDFSRGIEGFLIEKGKRSRPIASMNIAGNHKNFWKELIEVGNDPYLESSKRTPSLVFSPQMIAGR